MNINTLSRVVNTHNYPINNTQSTNYAALISQCRSKLGDTGLCLLPQFITPDALSVIINESQQLAPAAHHTEHWRSSPNGVIEADISQLAHSTRASIGSVAFDQLSEESPLRTLYQSTEFTAFLNDLFDGPTLYLTADPLVSCMLTILQPGDELGWHYDPNDIVVSLAVQQADNGGEFEFVPNIRAPAPNAQHNEATTLSGTHPGIISKSLAPGTLSLFNGHRSLHRVAPVGEGQPRIIALFNFSETPDYYFSRRIQNKFFGRHAH